MEPIKILSVPLLNENNHWAEFLLVEKSDPEAYIPERSTDEAIGYDLRAFNEFEILPGTLVKHNIKIKCTVPQGCYGRIAPRSGLAFSYHIDVFGGVIDRDYFEEINVLLYNHGEIPLKVNKGDKIAQLILEVARIVPVKEVKNIKELYASKTNRVGGFGSTGK